MSEVELGEGVDAVAVARGDVVVVRLPENPTTGYRWQVDTGDGVSLVDDVGEPGGNAPGSAGERILRLQADRPGTWPVVLRLSRPWEQEHVDERRVDVTVR